MISGSARPLRVWHCTHVARGVFAFLMKQPLTPPGENSTLRQMLHWSADVLDAADASFAQGTDNAHDEAAWLLLHALGEFLVYAPVRDQLGLRRARWCLTGGAKEKTGPEAGLDDCMDVGLASP